MPSFEFLKYVSRADACNVMALSLKVLEAKGYKQALRDYIAADRPFFGICLGMQTLFEGSEECPGVQVRIGRY